MILHFHLPDRPNLAELGWFACRWLLERIRFLQGGEAFPAHGAVGLQGQGDRWPVKGCDAKKVSPAIIGLCVRFPGPLWVWVEGEVSFEVSSCSCLPWH